MWNLNTFDILQMHIDGDVLTEDKWSPDTKRYYSE